MSTTRFDAYKVTNLVNGKLYIGITTSGIDARWKQHLRRVEKRAKGCLHLAIKKHGAAQFRIELVGSAPSWDELCVLERTLIASAGSLVPRGYNMTSGGEGTFAPCDALRAAIGLRTRQHASTPEARAANAARTKAQFASPEARAALSERLSLAQSTPAVRAANAKRAHVQFASPEARAAIAARTKAQFASPEARAAQAERSRAFMCKAEIRAINAERSRARMSTPEARAANAARAKAQFASPEARAAHGIAVQAGHRRNRAAWADHSELAQ